MKNAIFALTKIIQTASLVDSAAEQVNIIVESISNTMGIPAIMGIGSIKHLSAGESVIVDGNQGHIILSPDKTLLREYKKLIKQNTRHNKELEALRDLSARTLDGEVINLLTNTGLRADISPGLINGAQGVGLYRTEIPFMVCESFPSEDEQLAVYKQVLSAYTGKPVYMRILDIGGDKQLPYFPINNEENPALGWRGIRFCLDNSQLLMTQIRAMIRASEHTHNLHILLPMVSSTEELDDFHHLFDDACNQLRDEGLQFQIPKMGIMVEVPAAISQLSAWVKKIDFISIGSNDLSQYLLAMDRNNSRIANRYDHIHPAVLNEISRIVTSADKLGLPVSLCGEMASDPIAVVILVGMGIRTLSMSAARLLPIKSLIRSLCLDKAQILCQQALRLDSSTKIRALVTSRLNMDNVRLPNLN